MNGTAARRQLRYFPGDRMQLQLEIFPEPYAVCRLAPHAAAPTWARGGLVAITRTPDELSVICQQDKVPASTTATRGWRCLRVAGTLDFSLIGVIAGLTRVLATARISVLVTSTFDTDYLLIREPDLTQATTVLQAAGYPVAPASR